MAEIVLKIPKEFEQDFHTDKFKNCFKRVLWDCKAWNYAKASGRYEHEILEMLLDAFNEAVVLPKGHERLIDEKILLRKLRSRNFGFNLPTWVQVAIDNTPTTIEADKAESEEKG